MLCWKQSANILWSVTRAVAVQHVAEGENTHCAGSNIRYLWRNTVAVQCETTFHASTVSASNHCYSQPDLWIFFHSSLLLYFQPKQSWLGLDVSVQICEDIMKRAMGKENRNDKNGQLLHKSLGTRQQNRLKLEIKWDAGGDFGLFRRLHRP